MPISSVYPDAPEAEAVRGRSDQDEGVVLLVDDEDVVRLSTADMLKDLGFVVRHADFAETALSLVAEGLTPDLLVTDHLMPGMTGVELARALRNSIEALPVLIVSGYAEAEGLAPDLPRRTKPFRSAELEACIASSGIIKPADAQR